MPTIRHLKPQRFLRGAIALSVLYALSGCASTPATGDPVSTADADRSSGNCVESAMGEIAGMAQRIKCAQRTATTTAPRKKTSSKKNAPTDAQLSMAAGDQALQQGAYDAAIFGYVTALSYDPKRTDAYLKIAAIENAQGHADKAARAYQSALGLQPDNAEALQGYGLMMLRAGRAAEARPLLERAVARNPALWQAHNGLGMISDLGRDYVRAQTYYQQALKIRPGSPVVLNNLGYSRYLNGDMKGAQAYFEQAIMYDRDNDKAWSNLGLVHARSGKYDAAINALTHTMEAPAAYNSVGYLCMMSGRNAVAEKFFVKAIELSPSYYTAAYENLENVRARMSVGAR